MLRRMVDQVERVRYARPIAAAFCALFLVLSFGVAKSDQTLAVEVVLFPTDQIVLVTSDGMRHPFDVELALTPKQRRRGLMYRSSLAEDAGMLFLFGREDQRNIWMANTVVSLDILFLDKAGRVVSIARDAVPYSTDTIPSGVPAAGVLEVVAGTSDRLGIDLDAYVEHEAFADNP